MRFAFLELINIKSQLLRLGFFCWQYKLLTGKKLKFVFVAAVNLLNQLVKTKKSSSITETALNTYFKWVLVYEHCSFSHHIIYFFCNGFNHILVGMIHQYAIDQFDYGYHICFYQSSCSYCRSSDTDSRSYKR